MNRYAFFLLIVLTLAPGPHGLADSRGHESAAVADVTILCYMNGDNELAQEVLHALDMMETIGSSDRVNVVALIDGHASWLGPYSHRWDGTNLLLLQADPQIGVINSTPLERWGEDNLGNPDTLEKFIRIALERYPAKRYILYTFAHSKGIIDTSCFSDPDPGKTLSISRDTTSRSQMAIADFHDAIKRGLNGRRFDLIVLFSCLANMVEVGYALSDVSDYLVGSQDEIRLLNQPSGRYQIRGSRFEGVIGMLHRDPFTSVPDLGRHLVDSHVADYVEDAVYTTDTGIVEACRFSGGMALVDGSAMPGLVRHIDRLARLLLLHAEDAAIVNAMRSALRHTQTFASFLNMEYYDLSGFIRHLQAGLEQPDIVALCESILAMLEGNVIVYERHTPDCDAAGLSVYLSNPLVPDNIFKTHQTLYGRSRFARDTAWDEMIEIYRQKLR